MGLHYPEKKKYKYIQGPVRRSAKSMRKAARYYGI